MHKNQLGKIKTYSSEKSYGFITGEDAKDYFFHLSAVHNSISESELKKGTLVFFTSKENEKGLQAITVISPMSFGKEVAVDFFHSRKKEVPSLNIHSSVPLKTRLFQHPSDAKSHLINMAKSANATALLDVKIDSATVCNNKVDTIMHFYTGVASYATKTGYTCLEFESVVSEFYATSQSEEFYKKITKLQKKEDHLLARQLNSKELEHKSLIVPYILTSLSIIMMGCLFLL